MIADIDRMTQEKANKYFNGIPLKELRKNLEAVFSEYGVSRYTISHLCEEDMPYHRILGPDGKISEKGRKKMEYWASCTEFGDPRREVTFSNSMTDW